MNTLIVAEIGVKSKKNAALELFKGEHLKTKTKLSVQFDKKSHAEIDIMGQGSNDIVILGIGGGPLDKITLTVEGIPAFGRIINRSANAFAKIGISLGEPQEWEADSGVVEITGELALTGSDAGILAEVVGRLMMRALGAISGTHHPLTIYDLKQAIGIVWDAKNGDEQAQEILDWFSVRELIILEETKADRAAIAKAKREKAKAARAAEKKSPEAVKAAKIKAAKAKARKAKATKAVKAGTAKNGSKAKSASLVVDED